MATRTIKIPVFKFHTKTIQSILDPVAQQVTLVPCLILTAQRVLALVSPTVVLSSAYAVHCNRVLNLACEVLSVLTSCFVGEMVSTALIMKPPRGLTL